MSNEPATKIEISSEFKNGGYVATCLVNLIPWVTQPKTTPYEAVNHLINAVVEEKTKEGKIRNIDYVFTTPLK